VPALRGRHAAGRTHEIKHDGFRIIKMKNPSAPAVKREAEEDWSKEKWR
jgi:hypothetical protein